ncbi:MAG: ribosomal L7Ae/L30e/S12e/Gadd45 family protein [Candidatus Aenigmarchaeota archaeon]|nr:ribosomal L7Ae/L30e/S12e/Gadd45 family protein [Candidatus Aenigmarchaeota archaeon]
MDTTTTIKDALKAGTLVIGTKATGRGLKRGSLKAVIICGNAPAGVRADLARYAQLGQVPLATFEGDEIALGEICGKPFAILAVGVRRA